MCAGDSGRGPRLALSVGLPHHVKGTRMSRFIAVLEMHRSEIIARTWPVIPRDIKRRRAAERARRGRFPIRHRARGLQTGGAPRWITACMFVGKATGLTQDVARGVRGPVTSLWPCNKASSDDGAHT